MVGEYLITDEDVEQCCAKLFRSEMFIQNADVARYELISIACEVDSLMLGNLKEATENASLYVVYWVLLLDGQTELETLRKIRKTKCVPSIVDVLWHRSRGDFELHTIALELMYELCRSQRLSDDDLGRHRVAILTQAASRTTLSSSC
jgi:hypothetical protein